MIGLPASSQAAEMLFLGKPRGPFELNPKDAVIVGDAKSADAQAARKVVAEMQTEAEEALAALKKDPQADVFLNVKPLAIARLRDATNKINNLMDEKSAAATQRWQRLMIQAKYQFEDDAPMPETKKGDVRPRGDKRLARIKEALENYLKGSREILKFV
ncbi:unnamed protein product [Polarella glacialis]|uniref:Uncharacterized protein n=1 Tax=Polarella glacialis TaxID=89957 RepID=A0A813JQ29_POLGL|nr:unnamed protein product [Polarella glacialis]